MSRGARYVLGAFFVFCAICFLALAPTLGRALVIIALFCGAAAVACFSTRSHPITVRVLGGTIFLVCLAYLIQTVQSTTARVPEPSRNGRPPIVNGLISFVLFGLPSAYAAITGRYPLWGQGAEAFHGSRKKKKGKRAGGPRKSPPIYPPRM